MPKFCLQSIIIFFCLTSCTTNNHDPKTEDKNPQIESKVSLSPSVDTFVLIKFDKNIMLNWDNKTGRIKEDSLFNKIISDFENNKYVLINKLADTSETKAMTCHKNLVVGDLAFLIIDKVKQLPFFEITKVQCDHFTNECPYPEGYFEVIGRDRIKIKKEVSSLLLK